MKKFLILLVTYLSGLWAFAQSDIMAMEYYVDTDPGVGLATSVAITTGQDVDLTFSVPVSGMGLTIGFHLIVVRTQNSDGDWSLHEKRPFYIQESTSGPAPVIEDLVALEYFIDEDPGVGLATSVAITPGQDIDINELIVASSQPDGFHLIGVRAKNSVERWGFTERKIFFIQNVASIGSTPSDITTLEYFFDIDPGHGLGTSVSITQGQAIDINTLANAGSLSQGFHTISVRAQNSDGRWGMLETRILYIQNTGSGPAQLALISALEYYIDEDPGIGQGFQVPITPSLETVDIMSIALATGGSLSVGDHTLTIRAQNENGLWGHKETTTFSVDGDCPNAGFDVEQACAGEEFQLTDTSSGILGGVDYKWYADGIQISTTVGDITHSFENPGTHTFSLAIMNGALCTDSTGISIEVKAKPIVVFNAFEVEVGTPTAYLTDEFNLDPLSSWEWDFETDGIVDDTTPGNTSHLFSASGTYQTTVTVTDGLGCGTSFSRNIIVSGIVNALFESSAVCEGRSAEFTDLSTNVPADATYSWDFDGDGTEDDAIKGSPSFTYTTAGSYTATLLITTVDNELFTHSQAVTVVAVPTADFETGVACVGEPVQITDNSTDAGSYSWDFDGDGVEDSQTAGDATFTFTESGNYFASLVVDNGTGCFDFKTVNIHVETSPTANFEFKHTTSGTTATVVFENTSTNGSDYEWDFGDGNTSTDQEPTHSFENFDGKTYEVCLSAINACLTNQLCVSIEIPVVLAVSDLDGAEITAYPNPSYGILHLDFDNVPADVYQIVIYDLAGKPVFRRAQNTLLNTQFEKQKLPKGNYLLMITSSTFSSQQKLIVK